MVEERIVVKIDEEGKISAYTEGFQGEACLEQLEELLAGIADLNDIKKTDDYYKKNLVQRQSKKEIKRGRQ